MKSKTFAKILDILFWWLVYSLPLILWLISFNDNSTTLSNILDTYFRASDDGFIRNAIVNVFAPLGWHYTSAFINYFSYFIYTIILHLFIDILLWVPRFTHKLLDKSLNIRGLDYEK